MAEPASRVLRIGGLYFDGVDDYVRVPTFSRPQSFTILAWVYLTTTEHENPMVTMAPVETSSCYWRLMRFNAWTVEADWRFVFSPYLSWTINSWYFLGFSFNANSQTVTFYRNNEVYGPYSYPYTIRDVPSYVQIGNRGPAYFHGMIDEVRIYSRALSSYEISEIYTKGTFIKDGLVLCLPFYEGEGNIAHDVSGYGKHGTIYGASWVVKKALRVLPKAR